MRKALLGVSATAMLLGLEATSAMAVTSLILENPGSVTYQQTLNSPCVIGNASCNQPAGFGYTLISSGGSTTYDVSSPVYSALQITQVAGGSTFTIGFDVNSTTKPIATEELQSFDMKVNGVIVAQYTVAAPGTPLDDPNQGNGFSDELLKGFSLAGVDPTATVQFDMVINNATDGAEQAFIIGTKSVKAPEPASLAILGAGMFGLGMVRRRRNNA